MRLCVACAGHRDAELQLYRAHRVYRLSKSTVRVINYKRITTRTAELQLRVEVADSLSALYVAGVRVCDL